MELKNIILDRIPEMLKEMEDNPQPGSDIKAWYLGQISVQLMQGKVKWKIIGLAENREILEELLKELGIHHGDIHSENEVHTLYVL